MTDDFENDNSFLQVIIFCGPNGSGKTTLINQIKETGFPTLDGVYPMPQYFINPDQVAKDLTEVFPDQRSKDIAAFNAAIKLRDEAIASKVPFCYESVFSHSSRVNEMLRLKEQGYTLLVTFITTENPDINVARVKQRVETQTTTGHDVPEMTVRDRYERTLALLPKAVEIADGARIYDNSVDFQEPTVQAVIERNGRFDIAPDAKQWVIDRLVEPLQHRERDLAAIIDALESRHRPAGLPDELRGSYSGEVILATKNFVVQYDELTKQTVIHDRLMLDTSPDLNRDKTIAYKPGDALAIRYSQANAPTVDRQKQIEQVVSPEKIHVKILNATLKKSDNDIER